MWRCPICSGTEKIDHICNQCGFDDRTDFVRYRTICRVPKADVLRRNNLEDAAERRIKNTGEVIQKQETQKKKKFPVLIAGVAVVLCIGYFLVSGHAGEDTDQPSASLQAEAGTETGTDSETDMEDNMAETVMILGQSFDKSQIKTAAREDGGSVTDIYNEDGIRIGAFFYDENGILTSAENYDEDGSMTRAWWYDENGNMTASSVYNTIWNTHVTSWYDENGRITQVAWYNENNELTTCDWYNEDGSLGSKAEYDRENNTHVIHWYDADENIIKTAWYNADDTLNYFEIYEYDGDGSLTKTSRYDADGKLIQ